MTNQNKEHWDALNSGYDARTWTHAAKRRMAQKELGFVRRFLKVHSSGTILDIGAGNGRILQALSEGSGNAAQIYGLDISPEMIRVCQERFKGNGKIKDLTVSDVSSDDFRFTRKYDFITAIRVLKYSRNWREIIARIAEAALSDDGIFVFTMPNHNSINRFAKYEIPFHRSTKSEILKVCAQSGLEVLDIRTFTRIPDFFYELSDSRLYVSVLMAAEAVLGLVLGKTLLGRMLFVAAKKVTDASRNL